MATYVLVHGGGHGGWCYQPVARQLRGLGHEVHAPTLSGLADRAHLLSAATGLDTHIADIAGLIEYEDLNGVILVGHSYGGAVISGVAGRIPERIRHLVYLDASLPENGQSIIDNSPSLHALRKHNRIVDGVELGLWPDDPATLAIYGLAGCALEPWARARLTPHPWRSFTDRLSLVHPGALQSLPRTVINCTHTLTLRTEETRQRWLTGDNVWEIDTGHDLMLTEPEAVAAMLARLA
jgi:pimeloyl-ACP methyl ester carboxylesterase